MARKADIDDANKTENKIKIKGIKQKRYCTDVLCCIIYAVFNASIIYLGYWGFTYGSIYNIVTPFDSNGNICGQNNTNTILNLTNKPGLDMTNYTFKYLSKQFDYYA